MDDSQEGQVYAQRYKVIHYPHVAIIDPRTGRSLWKKEGWTQEKPFNAEAFAEVAMDFCSKHSFEKEPTSGKKKRIMSEKEQMQAALVASLKSDESDEDEYVMEDDDDDDVQCLGTQEEMLASKALPQEEEKKPAPAPSLIETLLSMPVGDEPADGARVQLRMPDAKRLVRRFQGSDPVKTLYAFVAVRNCVCRVILTFLSCTLAAK